MAAANGERIRRRVVNANRAYEAAQLEILLLNILRARDRKPLFFTTLQQTSGTVAPFPTLGVSTPFEHSVGPYPAGSVQIALGGQLQYVAANQVSDSFMRGIMQPVSPELLGFFLDEAWPGDFVLQMGVLRVERRVGGNVTESFDNWPRLIEQATSASGTALTRQSELPDPSTYKKFRTHLLELNPSNERLRMGSAGSAIDMTLPVAAMNAEDTARLIDALAAARTAKLKVDASDPSHVTINVHPKTTQIESRSGTIVFQMADQGSSKESQVAVLRSPEAMIYYLGQITRFTTAPQVPPAEWPSVRLENNPDEHLFVLLKEPSNCVPLLSVTYEGDEYIIPSGDAVPEQNQCHPGQSMRALNLVSQILQLQQSSADMPRTVNVNVVGNP